MIVMQNSNGITHHIGHVVPHRKHEGKLFILETEHCRGNQSRIIVSVFTVTVYIELKEDALSSEEDEEKYTDEDTVTWTETKEEMTQQSVAITLTTKLLHSIERPLLT